MTTLLIPLAIGLVGSYVSYLVQPAQKVGQISNLAMKPMTGYGSTIPQPYGRVRINTCPMIWSINLTEVITSSGKGFGSKTRTYNYYMTSAFLIGGQITGINRVWMNGIQVFNEDSKTSPYGGLTFFERLKLYEKGSISYNDAYNVGGSSYYTDTLSKNFAQKSERFLGNSNQPISTIISGVEGTDIPAYRYRSYIVTYHYPLADFNGTSFPTVDVEVFGKLGPTPLIRDIITDIFQTARFDTSKLDLSDIPADQYTQGLLYQRSGESYKDYIEEIQRLFFLVVREEEGVTYFLQKTRPFIDLNLYITNLGAKANKIKSDPPLFQEKILHQRELPSEVQLSMTNLGDSYNKWTIYARNPTVVNDNPLSIQTRMSSNPAETQGIANRMIAEVSVQRNTYSGMSILPCWYKQLKLGDVIELDIGRSIAIQLTKKTLTSDYIVQFEGNTYEDADYSIAYSYIVFVSYTTTTTVYGAVSSISNETLDAGHLTTKKALTHTITTTAYTLTYGSFIGNADNLTIGQIYAVGGAGGLTWAVFSDGHPIALTTPYAEPVTTLDTSNLSLYEGLAFLAPSYASNVKIVAVVQTPYAGTIAKYNSQFFAISQVENNTLPTTINTGAYGTPLADATLIPLDIPLISDGDAPFTIYFAIKNISGFSSGAIYYSLDSGSTFHLATSVTSSNTVGHIVGTMPGHGIPSIIDTNNSFIINSETVINSCTTDTFLAGGNLLLVGNEIIAFRDVTLLGSNQYEISYLIRGCKGTESTINGHGSGEQVVLLQNLNKFTANSTYINKTALFKLIPDDIDETEVTTTVSVTYKANTVKPYSIANLTYKKDSTTGDITINWNRRTYNFGGLHDYSDIGYSAGELEIYIINVFRGGIIRTINATTESFVYTYADQLVDYASYDLGAYGMNFNITQASSYVGNGEVVSLHIP